MRVPFLALVLITPLFLAAVPAVSAHADGCVAAVHAYDSSVHWDCSHGNHCVLDVRDPLLSMFVGCGYAENGNCLAKLRYKSMKIDVCMLKM